MEKAKTSSHPPLATNPHQWLSGKRWHLAQVEERITRTMMQRYGISGVLADLLTLRDVDIEAVESYLAPTLRDLLPDPFHLKDMDKAATRIATAIQNGETIGIFGDYDVDGATSSAILIHYLRALGCHSAVHIPDRQKEGYGPNLYGFGRLREQGATLIITVDTGTLAHSVLAEAAAAGFEVIVIDHHQGEPQLPEALAVVNPNRFDESSDYGYLAAVGVTFLTLVAVQKTLRELGYFLPRAHHSDQSLSGQVPGAKREGVGGEHPQSTTIPEPSLLNLLDIVALGTVCDVVPLTGLNRAFVQQGLKILGQRRNPGLTALMDVGRLEEAPNTYHLGFILGPRINAGGRVGLADLGVRLLTCGDYTEARPLAEQLDRYNEERRAIEAQVLEDATAQAERQQTPMLFVQGQNWHEGVIGIVAGRIKEAFNLPAAAISWNDQGIGKASARSIKGVDLGQAIIAARQQGLLEAGGGHAMAAGFTLKAEKFDAFAAFMETRLGAAITRYQHEHSNEIDAPLPLSAATIALCAEIEKAGPYGAGNASPRFLIENAKLIKADVLKEKHLRCIFVEGDAIATSGKGVKAMGFNLVESELGQRLLASVGQRFHLVVRLKSDSWQGRISVSLQLEDAAPC